MLSDPGRAERELTAKEYKGTTWGDANVQYLDNASGYITIHNRQNYSNFTFKISEFLKYKLYFNKAY